MAILAFGGAAPYTYSVRGVTVHLLAMWIAMCCCQWRAVGAAMGLQSIPSCCAPAEPVDPCCDNCCTGPDERSEDERPPADSNRCAGCCDKGLAPSADDLPSSLFDLHLDHLGTLLLHVPSIALPSIDRSIEHGTVWHPPPGRFRPLVCILTV